MNIACASCAAALAGTASYLAVFSRMARRCKQGRERAEAPPRRRAAALADTANRLLPQTQEAQGKLRKRLASAGIAISPNAYRGASVLLTAAAAVALLPAAAALDMRAPAKAALIAPVAAIVLLCPRAALSIKARARRERIEVELPQVLDLLATGIEAGLTPQRSIRLVAQHGKGPLAYEFGLADRDMSVMRYTLVEALDRMAGRCSVEALSQFVAALNAGTAVGASMGAVLQSQSDHAFKRRRKELRGRANKLPVKMIMPIGFLMLPAVVLAFAAPVAISLIAMLSSVN